jgi:hypothetical protein
MSPELISRKKTAEALSISVRLLDELTKNRVIPCVRIGRSVKYDVTDLQAFIDTRKSECNHGQPNNAAERCANGTVLRPTR